MKKFFKLFIIFGLLSIIPTQTSIHAADDNGNTENNKVYIGGEAFGIKLFSEGLMVIKTESFKNGNSTLSPAEDAGLKENDIIVSANEKELKSSKKFKEIVENSEGEPIELKIKRNDKIITTNLCPQQDDNGFYKVGVWIKDSAAGLGTITFYSEELSSFCGLGHGICEPDTNTLIPLSYGDTENANITSVTKSYSGNVGSLNGYFTGDKIGEILDNNNCGIYGISTTTISNKKAFEIASKNEVEKGDAYIYTTIDSNTPKPYKIKITKIKKNDAETNMVIKITDEELLEATGGIVQGMSGSPIVQNNKLVGAVTHVLVDSVDMGYGIFAETMYEKMIDVCSSNQTS